jgi:membrane protein
MPKTGSIKPHQSGRSLRLAGALIPATFLVGLAAGIHLDRGFSQSLPRKDQPAGAPSTRPGINASSPTDIPAAGWRQILVRTWKSFNSDQILAVAGGVTFFSLLALFPALGAFVSLYGMISNVEDARREILGLAGVLPGGAVTVIGDQMTRLAATNHAHLSFAFAAGLLISVWSANAGVKALMSGLNVAYEENEKRGFIALNLMSLAFTIGLTAFSVGGIAAVVAAPRVLVAIGVGRFDEEGLLHWPLLAVVTVTVLALLYRYGPSREHARWRWISPGSVVAAGSWIMMSVAFSLYVANFGHYNQTYGALGALIGFMTWIWLSVTVVLLGAELNSQVEQQTSVDTTTGAPRPAGLRGARVSDRGPRFV